MGEYKSGDVALHFREAGSGSPVVLLHAFPLSSAMWEGQIAALAKSHRVVAPDFRGFGRSSVPPGPYRMAQMADDVLTLCDHLAIDRAAFVGLSMGGYVAFAIARRAPERLARLVLCDTKAGADSEEARLAREDTANLLKTRGPEVLIERTFPKLVAPGASEAVKGQVAALVRAVDPRGAAGALRGMAMRPDSSDLLPRIGVPALVVVGAEDALTPVDEARRMAAAISGATIAVLPGAGHLSNLEAPAAFDEAVGKFLT